VTVTLHAFLVRRAGLSHEEFLAYWHDRHGPLIRDTPGLARHLRRYEQHPVEAHDRSGYDGVAVQEFASWADFVAMLAEPGAAAMRDDEHAFLDPDRLVVVFTETAHVVVGPEGTGPDE
jgi:uncharacterized protein (TIGR02118 family)